MKPEIVTVDPIEVLYVHRTGNYDTSSQSAWSTLMPFVYSNKLMKSETRMFGIPHDDPSVTEPDKLRYDACLNLPLPDGETGEIAAKQIPGGKYAVFLHKGSYYEMANTYHHAFGEWLPNSGEELRDVPCFEEYLNRDPRKTKPVQKHSPVA